MRPAPASPLLQALLAMTLAAGGARALGGALQARAAAQSHALPGDGRRLLAPAAITPALVRRGAALFRNSCAHCHGADAHGDEGPDLHGLMVSDRRIATVVTRGIEGEMPSFARKHHHEDIVALIAYLRTLD